ncbi:hypothetical protein [Haploplasma axanthum]|uniref:Uncharacterized protein n=1 Tax=Haploplasma axanthum TaxID=29552 RepID=A0A449BBI8_HAPAX|nr:hypothetical protein [Haploplasma axanthum]VEU79799.1 Uncharacterised protein [Haploplasma axanthum]
MKRSSKGLLLAVWIIYLVLGILFILGNRKEYDINSSFFTLTILFIFPFGIYYDQIIDYSKKIKIIFWAIQFLFFTTTTILVYIKVQYVIFAIVTSILFLVTNILYLYIAKNIFKEKKEVLYSKRWNIEINTRNQISIIEYLDKKRMSFWIIFIEVIVYIILSNYLVRIINIDENSLKYLLVIMITGINAAIVYFDTLKLKMNKLIMIRQIALIVFATIMFGIGYVKEPRVSFNYFQILSLTLYIGYLVLPLDLAKATIEFYEAFNDKNQ